MQQQQQQQPARQKVEKLSAEVVDSNPYSRLMALQRMGIVKDYEQIRHKTVSPTDLVTLPRVWPDLGAHCEPAATTTKPQSHTRTLHAWHASVIR